MENNSANQLIEPAYAPQFMDLDPVKTTQFEADGTTWFIDRTNSLSVERKRWLEQFETFCLLGRDGNSFIDAIQRIAIANNQSKPGDVGVICDNLLKGVSDLTNKYSPILYVCTLFINEAGEDINEYTTRLGTQKIQRWAQATPTIPNDFFLIVAFSYLKISKETWLSIIETYSGLPNNTPPMPED